MRSPSGETSSTVPLQESITLKNGTYLFLSKKDNGVVFEYKVDILDESFNLSYVHITANNDTFHIDFDN